MDNCHHETEELYNYYRTQTPAQWLDNSCLEISVAEKQQEFAQRLALQADRLIGRSNESVLKKESEVDHRSKVTVKDVEYKCDEIEKQKHNVVEEIDLLVACQKRIEYVINNFSAEALDAIAECLRLRKCRASIDLIFDNVEEQLIRERELILIVKLQLEDLFDKVMIQIRKLRKFDVDLGEDLHGKLETLKIENHGRTFNEKNIDLCILDDQHVIEEAKVSLTNWNRYSTELILAANQALVESRPTRVSFDNISTKLIADLAVQAEVVNKAIRLRVVDYQEVIVKLKTQRAEIIKNLKIVEESIEKLHKAIDEKATHIALVTTRLLNRSHREGINLCRDELEVKLREEETELLDDLNNLKTLLTESVTCHRRLGQSIARIDAQLQVKENSLKIDNVLCLEQRKRINYDNIF
ncbi:Tektin [Cinara cedri]|uniref:Tektin n=1 Tax=Cinara cedri TaxID=506608 RepID=A0A5E4M5S3_9HEMI|nr:Tektin [Cinara cedri]